MHSYMFDIWLGFTEVNIDLLKFWWLWRRSKPLTVILQLVIALKVIIIVGLVARCVGSS